MSLFGGLIGFLKLFGKNVLTSGLAPVEADVYTAAELDELIKHYRSFLTDHWSEKYERMRAAALLGLAVSYYRRALYHSGFDKDDVNHALRFAHEAEAFHTRETTPRAWETIQQVLGFGYVLKADGPKSEHFGLAIPYLENCLTSSAAPHLPGYESEVHLWLVMAYAACGSFADEVKRAKVAEHAALAEKLYPFPQDKKWRAHAANVRNMARLALGRSVYDFGSVEELELVCSLRFWEDEEGGVGDDMPVTARVFSALAKIIASLDAGADGTESAEQTGEKSEPTEDAVEAALREAVALVESAEEPRERAEAEAALSLALMFKAALVTDPDEREESLRRSRALFESSWGWTLEHMPRSMRLVTPGCVHGTLLYFYHEEWEGAARVYARTLDVIDRDYRASVGIRGKEVALAGVSWQGTSLSLNHAYALARMGRAEEAVMILEKWRGRQLGERMKRGDRLLARVKAEDLAAYQRLWAEIESLESAQRDADAYDYLREGNRLRAARAELETLVARIRRDVPEFLPEPTFEEVRLAAAEGPLAYLLATAMGTLVILVTTAGETRCLWADEFTSHDVETILKSLSPALGLAETKNGGGAAAASKVLPAALEELGGKLLAGLSEALKEERAEGVCLIPCGALALFPLHAATVEGVRALPQECAVSYAPSALTLLKARQNRERFQAGPGADAPSLLCVSDPGRNLEYAKAEAKSIAALWPDEAAVTRLEHEAATRAALKGAVSRATHLHFACHGTFDSDSPLGSALLLAGGERLTLRDVLDERSFLPATPPRLVVLSACQTALIGFKNLPEEATGLPTGFLGAGVPGVVGTLWPVDDYSTSLLMTRFYDNLLKKKFAPAAALQEAQTWLSRSTWAGLESYTAALPTRSNDEQTRDAHARARAARAATDPPFADPYFWAGFIFVGN